MCCLGGKNSVVKGLRALSGPMYYIYIYIYIYM